MSKRETIMTLLDKWDELREQGREIPAEQLCDDCPEILPELKNRIDQLKAMDWLDSPANDLPHSPKPQHADLLPSFLVLR